MAVNTVRIAQGMTVAIGTGAASPAALTSGGTTIANVKSVTFSGRSSAVPVSEPLDADVVIKRKGITNPGTATLTFDTDADDAGQTALRAAAVHATNAYPFRIFDGSTNLISFEGFVSAHNPNSAGTGGSYVMTEITVDLIRDPT